MNLSYNITKPYKQFSKTFWKNLFYTSFITIVLTSLRTGALYFDTTHSDKKEVLGTEEPIAEQQEEIVEEEYGIEDWNEKEQYEKDIVFFVAYIMTNTQIIENAFYEIENGPVFDEPWGVIERSVSKCRYATYGGEKELLPEDLLPKVERIENLTQDFCDTLMFSIEKVKILEDETDADLITEGYREIKEHNVDAYDTSELIARYMYELIELIKDEDGEDI